MAVTEGSIVDRQHLQRESKTFVERWSQEPRVGKIRAAKDIEEKRGHKCLATSFSWRE